MSASGSRNTTSYDPDNGELEGWLRDGDTLRKIPEMDGWVSPRLGVRFELDGIQLRLYHPDGRPFLSYVELTRQVDEQRQQLDEQRRRVERLAAQLKTLGLEPET